MGQATRAAAIKAALGGAGEGQAVWSPALSIREDASNLYIEVELPGIATEDVQIEVHEGALCVRGRRVSPVPAGDYLMLDRHFGSFLRSCQLPAQIRAEDVAMDWHDGVLVVTLPKRSATPEQSLRRSGASYQEYWIS